MMWEFYETFVPGKWVLAGEHSVLRGGGAIALPHPGLGMRLSFEPDPKIMSLRIVPASAADTVQALLQRLGKELNIDLNPHGVLRLESTIPQGAGFGSSAALCVALTRWVASRCELSRSLQKEISVRLEHSFHGKSSGMDVAVVSENAPIYFVNGQSERLNLTHLPQFQFHDTGLRSLTRESVARVNQLREQNPELGKNLDQKMIQSVQALRAILEHYQRLQGLDVLQALATAMNEAQSVFEAWGLVPASVQQQVMDLHSQGALAVKLTGAGGGGFLVSLWNSDRY